MRTHEIDQKRERMSDKVLSLVQERSSQIEMITRNNWIKSSTKIVNDRVKLLIERDDLKRGKVINPEF